jgi:hypothetical protein
MILPMWPAVESKIAAAGIYWQFALDKRRGSQVQQPIHITANGSNNHQVLY